MDAYYRGDHPLPFVTRAHEAKLHDEFRKLLEDSRSNFMRLVVDVPEERLNVTGFRLSASTDAEADQASWDVWQANGMDAQSQVAFVEALVKGVSYLSVWADTDNDGYADIAVEDPLQTIVGYEPGSNYTRRAAALKVWCDDWTGNERANVYLPDGIYKFESQGEPVVTGPTTPQSYALEQGGYQARWKELPDEFLPNPFGIVPIIPLRNRPRIRCEGESELADVYRVQNQINGFLFLLALAGYFGAHRQRWASGITIMKDEKTGKPVEPFRTAVDQLWVSTNGEAKFGDFEQTTLDGYIKAIEQKVSHIAITTRTPKHYMQPEGQEPSGDAIKSAESGLVKKVERKMRLFGEGLEEAIRLARLFQGESDVPVDSEMVWADPQVRTEAEITDATIKKYQALLISRTQALEDLGYSPQQIIRIGDTLATENPPPPEPPQVDPAGTITAGIDQVRADVMSLGQTMLELKATVSGLAPVEPPTVNFNAGAFQPPAAPTVTVEAPQITIESPAITVEAAPAPNVNVTADLIVGKRKLNIQRDAQGNITNLEEV